MAGSDDTNSTLEQELADLNISITAQEDDMVRGYGLETNQYQETYFEPMDDLEGIEGHEYVQGEVDDEDSGADKPPEMPQEYYHQIDEFLKKAPPKLGDDAEDKKKKKRKKGDIVDQNANQHTTQLNIRAVVKASAANNAAGDMIAENAADKRRNKPKADKPTVNKEPSHGTSQQPPRGIDNQLLKEAFAYTDQLLRDAVMEEAIEKQSLQQQVKRENKGHQQQHQQQYSASTAKKYSAYSSAMDTNSVSGMHEDTMSLAYQAHHAGASGPFPKSAPAELMSQKKPSASGRKQPAGQAGAGAGQAGAGAGGMRAVQMVRNLKNKSTSETTIARRQPQGDFIVSKESENDLKRNPVDFDGLLANFQSGSTLEKLRKELAESQQSLAQSEDVVRHLTGMRSLGKKKG